MPLSWIRWHFFQINTVLLSQPFNIIVLLFFSIGSICRKIIVSMAEIFVCLFEFQTNKQTLSWILSKVQERSESPDYILDV